VALGTDAKGSAGAVNVLRGIEASAPAGSRASSQTRMSSSGRSEFNDCRRCVFSLAVSALSSR
jgi:hypothetical protein